MMSLLLLLENMPLPVLSILALGAFLWLLIALLLVACSAPATQRMVQVLDAFSRLFYGRNMYTARARGRKHVRRHGGK